MKPLKTLVAAALVGWMAFVPAERVARAEPDAGVVGTGTPGSCTETALNSALAGGGNITFNCGGPATITITSLKTLTQPTFIDGGSVITISGGLATRLFYAPAPASLAISNITLYNAYTNASDGGALTAGGPMTVTNVNFKNNVILGYCGAAIWTNGSLVVRNSQFNSNSSNYAGGAVCTGNFGTANVKISDSFFNFNEALDVTNGFGGAIFVGEGARLSLLDTAFLSNRAHFGGAVYTAKNAQVTFDATPTSIIFASKTQLNANSATEDGGALYNNDGAMTINNTILTVNKTPTQTLLAGYGGAIHSSGALTVTNAIISNNEGRYGGGIFIGGQLDHGSALIDRVLFARNVSGNLGGAIYTNNLTTTVTISNSAFNRNVASTGGGLARNNTTLRIYNSSFTNNEAVQGGGLYLGAVPFATSGPYVRVQNVTVSYNKASSGAGGGVMNTGRAELYSTTIVSNTSGVYSAGSGNTRFRDSVLQNPGGLNCDGDGSAQISDDAKNYSTDASCVLPSSTTGVGLDPLLGPLTFDTVGYTAYHAPLAGSPLINGAFNCLDRDQLNALRPDTCDIGAIEFGGQRTQSLLPVVVRE